MLYQVTRKYDDILVYSLLDPPSLSFLACRRAYVGGVRVGLSGRVRGVLSRSRRFSLGGILVSSDSCLTLLLLPCCCPAAACCAAGPRPEHMLSSTYHCAREENKLESCYC